MAGAMPDSRCYSVTIFCDWSRWPARLNMILSRAKDDTSASYNRNGVYCPADSYIREVLIGMPQSAAAFRIPSIACMGPGSREMLPDRSRSKKGSKLDDPARTRP